MDYILDTHTLLWFLSGQKTLSKKANDIIMDSKINKSVSIASLWEIAIKNRIGKLSLKNGVTDFFERIESMGFGLLNIDRKCVEMCNTLPLIHRDPFDGIIIATAIVHHMTIITKDTNIQQYNVSWIW